MDTPHVKKRIALAARMAVRVLAVVALMRRYLERLNRLGLVDIPLVAQSLKHQMPKELLSFAALQLVRVNGKHCFSVHRLHISWLHHCIQFNWLPVGTAWSNFMKCDEHGCECLSTFPCFHSGFNATLIRVFFCPC